ncbi:MAG TPA: YkvA family protein [Cyclobacteriaceae bacterium]|nr:YkvA family protein [Cyclobacteriaceae bacterium]
MKKKKVTSVEENKEGFLAKVKATYQTKAESIASNRDKLRELLQKASHKLSEVAEIPAVKESKAQIEVVFRMLKAYYTKEYRGVSTRTLGLLVLGVLYFVLPVDFIPDFIPVVGYIDDITVIMAIFKSLNTDIEKFLEWERTKPQ